GFGAVTRADECYWVGAATCARHGIPPCHVKEMVTGDDVRDWGIVNTLAAIWPYEPDSLKPASNLPTLRFLWPYRAELSERSAYGATQLGRGLSWFEYSMFFKDRYRRPFTIAFACISTHNQFVLDLGARLFNRHAPVIKFPAGSSEEDYFGLLGLLNSST